MTALDVLRRLVELHGQTFWHGIDYNDALLNLLTDARTVLADADGLDGHGRAILCYPEPPQ